MQWQVAVIAVIPLLTLLTVWEVAAYVVERRRGK